MVACHMTPTDEAKVDALCRCIMEEKDPFKLTLLMTQLNDLLERKTALKVNESERKKKPT